MDGTCRASQGKSSVNFGETPWVSPNKTGSNSVVQGINRPQLGLLKSAILHCDDAAWLLPVMVGYWDCLLLDFPQK